MVRVAAWTDYVLWCLLLYVVDGRQLRILGLQPMSGFIWTGGPACVAPIQMAIDDVHAHPGLLDGYNLTFDLVDSQCEAGPSVFKMFNALYQKVPYNIILGPACSSSCEATGEVSHLWNLTQISYAGSSPVLSDRERFPYFYRMGTPDQDYIQARIALLKQYNWSRIATIYQAIDYFSVSSDDFDRELQHNNITVTSQEIFLSDPYTRVQNLKNSDARIIYAAMYEDKARRLLCAAYKVGLYGPKIVWILSGWYSDTFWKVKLQTVDCTAEQMGAVVEGSFLLLTAYMNPVLERGVANLTVPEFLERYRAHPLYNPDAKDFEFVSALCYDHLWIAALGLNCTDQRLKEINHTKSLDQFNYTDGDINKILFECIGNFSFIGVSGRISFKTGELNKIVRLDRIQGGRRMLVAYYRQDKRPSYYEWIEGAMVWKDGVIPRDSTYIYYKEQLIPLSMSVLMCSFAGLGILLSAFFFVFNVVYKSNKIVKLSSPNINNVLLFGCVLCYITIFLETIKTNNIICEARVFTFCLGFTVTFGSLFSKTWRVYRIFTNKKLLRRTIKDLRLIGMSGVFAAVVCTVILIWLLLAPHDTIIYYLKNEVYTIGNDMEVRPYVRMCHSKYSLYFSWAIYVMEGALLAFGAFLAWETRHLKIEALNDSQQIGLCLYNVVILSAVGLTLSFVLGQQVVLLYGVTCGCLLIGTTLTQVIVFIPKVYAVYQHEYTKSTATLTSKTGASTLLAKIASGSSSATNQEKVTLGQVDSTF